MKLSLMFLALCVSVMACDAHTLTSPPPSAPEASTGSSTVKVLPPSHSVTGVYPPSCHVVQERLPDPRCTPGAVSDNVTQLTIDRTICRSGWTATVRAPSSQTDRVKTQAMAAYGVPAPDRATTELDHFVPLELGGSNDVSNLWPERSDLPGAGFSNTKDHVENVLKGAVCSHQLALDLAQHAIVKNWTTALQDLRLS